MPEQGVERGGLPVPARGLREPRHLLPVRAPPQRVRGQARLREVMLMGRTLAEEFGGNVEKRESFKPPKTLEKLWSNYKKDFKGRFEDAAKINRAGIWNSLYSGNVKARREAAFDYAFFAYLSGRISREQAIDRLRKTESLPEKEHPEFLKKTLGFLASSEKEEGAKEQAKDWTAPEKRERSKKWLSFTDWIETLPPDLRKKALRRAAFFKHLAEDKPEGVDARVHRLNFLSEVKDLIDFKEVDELHNLVHSRHIVRLGEKNQRIAERKYAEITGLRSDLEGLQKKLASQEGKSFGVLRDLSKHRKKEQSPDSKTAEAEIYGRVVLSGLELHDLKRGQREKMLRLKEALKDYRKARTQMVGVMRLSGQIDTATAKEELLKIYAHEAPGKPVVDAVSEENLEGSSKNAAEKNVRGIILSLLNSM